MTQDAIISLERGLEILRAFNAEDGTLGIHDLMRSTGLPKATVARLTHTLVELGYLGQTHFQGRYHIGDSVIGLGNAVLPNLPIGKIATPLLQDLADRFNMSTALGAGDRTNMIYLAYCRGRDTVSLRMRTGAMLPMHNTAMGRAYLWSLDEARRKHHMELIRASGVDMDVVNRDLEAAFIELNRVGFACSFGDWRRDIYAVAVPLVIDEGETFLTLNCGASRHGQSATSFREEIGPALKSVAREITNTAARLRVNFWNE